MGCCVLGAPFVPPVIPDISHNQQPHPSAKTQLGLVENELTKLTGDCPKQRSAGAGPEELLR